MPSGDVVVRVLDGEDTIGGSKILVGWGGDGVFLDFGINYSHWGRYFEEYVKPRTTYGLGDLWKLGLVPPVRNLYRPDVVPQGLAAESELPVKRILGVYVSHAHLDHAGLIGLLDYPVPLVCSRTTAAIMKSVQDTQKADIFSQSVYSSPYHVDKVGGQAVLKGKRDAPFEGRGCFLTDGAGNGFERFWGELPGATSKTKGLRAGDLRAQQPSSGGVHATARVVDHSVLGANGFLLETPQGAVAYSGDLRAHGVNAEGTRSFLDGLVAHPPWILIMEGTQVKEKGTKVAEHPLGLATGEDEVEANCLAAVERHAGELVVADFAPRNVERLEAFVRIARATRRRLVVLPKDAYLLHGMHAANASVPLPGHDLLVYDPPAAKEAKWEEWILNEYRTHVVHSGDVKRNQSEYILALSFWDIKHLLDVEPERGAYIFSSSEAHSEEQAIDMDRLANWLDRFHLKPYGFHTEPDAQKPGGRVVRFDRGFHASGHMPGDEVLEWVQRIRPEHVLPVHTVHRGVFETELKDSGIKLLRGGTP